MVTWKFEMEDDDGTTHAIYIPNTLFVPEEPFDLFSPQHSGQEIAGPKGSYFIMKDDKMGLTWNRGEQ